MRQEKDVCACTCTVHLVDLLVGIHNTHCMSVCGFVTDYYSSLSPNDTLSLYRVRGLQRCMLLLEAIPIQWKLWPGLGPI